VIEGHKYTEPVLICELHTFADEVAVVQDVVVSENYAFGKTGRTRGVLYVDGVIKVQLFLAFEQRFVWQRIAHIQDFVPGVHSRRFFAPD